MLAENTTSTLAAGSIRLPAESQRACGRRGILRSTARYYRLSPSRQTDSLLEGVHSLHRVHAWCDCCPELEPHLRSSHFPTDKYGHPRLVRRIATPTHVAGACRPMPHKRARLLEKPKLQVCFPSRQESFGPSNLAEN